MIIPIIGLLLGVVIGLVSGITIPLQFTTYTAVAILAALDTVFGGVRSGIEKNFDMEIFVSGFFTNALLAAALTYLGDRLGLPIYYAAIFAFGVRLFNNFAIIRREIIVKSRETKNKVL